MIFTLFLSLLQELLHVNLPSLIHWMKPQKGGGVFSDHIIQNFSMNVAAFIFAYRFLFEKKHRLLYAIIFILMGFDIIFLSTSRTGYGIFFLLLCYLGLVRFGWKGIASAGALCVIMLGVAFFVSQNFQTRTKNIYEHYHHYNKIHHITSIGQRIEMYHIANIMIRHRPWFGYGTGGIQTALPTLVPAKDRVFNPHIDFVESIYLDFLLEFGVFGFIVLL